MAAMSARETESPESTAAAAVAADTRERYPCSNNRQRPNNGTRGGSASRVYRRGNAIRAWIGPRYAGTVAVIIRQMEMLLNRGSFAYVKTALAGVVARRGVLFPRRQYRPPRNSSRLRRKREIARAKSRRWTSRDMHDSRDSLQQIMLIAWS